MPAAVFIGMSKPDERVRCAAWQLPIQGPWGIVLEGQADAANAARSQRGAGAPATGPGHAGRAMELPRQAPPRFIVGVLMDALACVEE